MQRRATAIALVLVVAGIAVGLAGAPVTAQDNNDHTPAATLSSSSSDCPSPSNADFEIQTNKSDADNRTLDPGEEEIGWIDIEAGEPRDLMVDLQTSNDQLDVEVFKKDAQGNCVEFNETDCEQSVTQTGDTTICTLEDPDSGAQRYWGHFLNAELTDSLTYKAWAPAS